MSNNLTVKVSRRVNEGAESWEGTVNLPGVAPTKLLKVKTSESRFATRSGLATAAQRLASRYGFAEVTFEGATEKKVTKDAPKVTKKKTTKTPQTEASTS